MQDDYADFVETGAYKAHAGLKGAKQRSGSSSSKRAPTIQNLWLYGTYSVQCSGPRYRQIKRKLRRKVQLKEKVSAFIVCAELIIVCARSGCSNKVRMAGWPLSGNRYATQATRPSTRAWSTGSIRERSTRTLQAKRCALYYIILYYVMLH